MEKVRYMISDAADMVHVETHVLRYWEEELELAIPRNEMGHRYYTRDNIKEFQKIKDLKDQGYQLKAIRMILHNGKLPEKEEIFGQATANTELEHAQMMKVVSQMFAEGKPSEPVAQTPSTAASQVQLQPQETEFSQRGVSGLSPEERMSQFRELMSEIVGRAIAQNNEELSQTIGRDVQEMVLKEMNYLMREQDNAQEERYRKLDAAIRGQIKKKKPLFGGKKKGPS